MGLLKIHPRKAVCVWWLVAFTILLDELPIVYLGHRVSFPPSKLVGLGLQSLLGGIQDNPAVFRVLRMFMTNPVWN